MPISTEAIASLNRFGVPFTGTHTMLQPKQAYRFRVLFYAVSGGREVDMVALTRNVQSVGRPRVRHGEVEVHSYNSIGYYAGKHSWDPIELVIRDDVCSEAIRRLTEMYYRQFDHLNQAGALGAVTYKFHMAIDYLDGGNPGARTLESWNLLGCFISSLDPGSMDYTRGDDFLTLTMNIRYDNAVMVINNETISAAPVRDNCGIVVSEPLRVGGSVGRVGSVDGGGGTPTPI